MTESKQPSNDPAAGRVEGPPSSGDESIPVAEIAEEQSFADLDLSSSDFEGTSVEDADRKSGETGKPLFPSKRQPPQLPPKQLVLIGAGTTHLQIVNSWPKDRIPGVELTLVTAFDHAAFHRMLPGALAQLYEPDQMLIDLPRLCEARGVRLIVDRANSFDPIAQEIEFAHQPKLFFDLASINIGSVPTREELWQSHRIMISTKPASTFLARFHVRFHELVEQWKQAPGEEMLQVAVVGSNLEAVEMAFALEQHRFDLELPIDVRIIDESSEILAGFPASTVRKVCKLFRQRGIETSLGSKVVDCDDLGPSTLVLENGDRIRADLVVWVAEPAPPMAVKGFQLSKSPKGFLKVRPTLQATDDVPVFIAGEVSDLGNSAMADTRRNWIRQANVLRSNLTQWYGTRPFTNFRPKKPSFVLLSCADRTAILSHKWICLRAHWVWWLKDQLDRQWVRRFQI